MQEYEIIIVGGGPAGCATALELASANPALASRTLVLDKSVFPRFKLCAGGVTLFADNVLSHLRVHVDVPDHKIDFSRFVLPAGCLTFEYPSHFRVVRRDQFDAVLLKTVKQRGVHVKDGEAVEGIFQDSHGVIVQTTTGEYRAKILIGADGSNSTVRQAIGLTRAARLMIAMETFVPFSQTNIRQFPERSAIFDLSVTARGVPGYCWIFPTAFDGRGSVSLGIMAAPLLRSEPLALREAFEKWLTEQGGDLNSLELASHPILRYEPRATSSAKRVLLTGDAAGIDPLFGEGIHCALALGVVTARYAADALKKNDFRFPDYDQQIRSSSIGAAMRRRRLLANRLYAQPKLGTRYLQHGTLLKWLARLRLPITTGKLTWEPS